MKRLIWMIFITLLTAGVAAQTKVVERSAKKVPGWLNTAVEDYLVVSVTAGSLAEGQTKALTEITERIIQSVASNVTVSKKNTLSEVNVNGNIESSDAFTQISRIKSANLPFLKGLSPNRFLRHWKGKSLSEKEDWQTLSWIFASKHPKILCFHSH